MNELIDSPKIHQILLYIAILFIFRNSSSSGVSIILADPWRIDKALGGGYNRPRVIPGTDFTICQC